MNLFKKILIGIVMIAIIIASYFLLISTNEEGEYVGLRQYTEYIILDDVGTTTGTSLPILTEDFRDGIFSVATDGDGDADLTVKFLGSLQDTLPVFDDPQSATNTWDYIQVIDLEDGSALDGDTGLVISATDDYRLLEANVNGLKWLTAKVTSWAAGEVTVKVKLLTNQ